MGQVVDWSSHHVLYPQGASLRAMTLGERDARAYWNYLNLVKAANDGRFHYQPGGEKHRLMPPQIDWSVSLGTAGAAAHMYPAKYSFNVNATPNCSNDYVVFPINVNGSATQATIAAFNNLYTGSSSTSCSSTVNIAASPTGAVENGARTTATITTMTSHGLTIGDSVVISGVANASFNGTFAVATTPSTTTFTVANASPLANATSGGGTAAISTGPTVIWAYRPATTGTTRTRTSPILSLDGTKVAFLDGNSPAIFHVLTPTAGQGTVAAPAVPTGAQMASVTLTGATTDTNSPPFVDYYGDVAYVGTNNGMLFKITGVFKGTPALAGAPWPLTAGAGTLTGPVIDFGTGNIFVGSSDGNLYGFTAAGAAITNSPLTVGSGRANGGIADPPVVDVVNGLIYVTSGEEPTRTFAVVVEASTSSFAAANVNVADIGNNNAAPLHAGAFNDAYFSVPTNMTGTTSEWFFYVCGVAPGAGTNPVLYRVGFNGTPRKMNTTASATTVTLSANGGEQCSPITELKNGVDRIFLGLLTTAVVEFFDISTTTTPTLGGTGGVAPVAESGGTSGIIVDNISAIPQASSIYFTTQANSANCGTHRCGVKLTQSGLQ